jgi:hypothetical protein
MLFKVTSDAVTRLLIWLNRAPRSTGVDSTDGLATVGWTVSPGIGTMNALRRSLSLALAAR